MEIGARAAHLRSGDFVRSKQSTNSPALALNIPSRKADVLGIPYRADTEG